MTKPAEIIRSFYDKLKAGDAPGALGLMAHDIEWITMWHYKVVGRGPERVAEGLFKPLMEEWSSFALDPSEFIVDGDTVVSLGRFTGVHGVNRQEGRSWLRACLDGEGRQDYALSPIHRYAGDRGGTSVMNRPPLPPFSEESALQKVRAAENSWNTRDPARVVLAYTPDSRWRNRAEFPSGRAEIEAFLTRKWTRELDYRLIKELWTFARDRIAVRFAYEYHEDNGQWFRAYGNENWQFDAAGLMEQRFASINEHPITEAERKFRWPLGRRPDDHPSLSDLGL